MPARRPARERTFTVQGHHYALVHVDRAARGRRDAVRGARSTASVVWPEPRAASRRASCAPTRRAGRCGSSFGSCRVAVAARAAAHAAQGRGPRGPRGRRAARPRPAHDPHRRPRSGRTRCCMLGDQVYADEVHPRVKDEIVGEQVIDYDEYVELYSRRLGRADDPLAALHRAERDDLRRPRRPRRLEHVAGLGRGDAPQAWWRPRVISAFESYFVYQHLGNLSPEEREQDEIYRGLRTERDPDGVPACVRRARRPRGRRHALELLPRHRAGAGGDGRLARRARARRPATARWSTPTNGAGSKSTPAATSSTC